MSVPYWCHTVSVFTAFSPNRIGECDAHCSVYCRVSTTCRIYWCTMQALRKPPHDE